jgi:uncharacterized cysteine cluster protein YcgN (CxxCxxCC family)
MTAPFWKTTPLEAMNAEQWESLCDGCGKCCAFTLEDEETGEIFRTRVACRLFDAAACGCADYDNRFSRVSQCIKVTPRNVRELTFFPVSCAYRLVAQGSDLPDWHHLVCGDREEIHRRGQSIRGQTISEELVDDDAFEDHILDGA